MSVQAEGLREVQLLLKKFRDESPKALARAVNHGLKQGEIEAVNGIYRKAALTKRVIREQITIVKASNRTTGADFSGRVDMKGRPINLLSYGAKQTNNGVTFRIWRAGSRERYRHAMIWSLLRSRYTGVLEPNIDHPKYKKLLDAGTMRPEDIMQRSPLRRKTGPSVPMIYAKTPGLAEKAEARANESMQQELARQLALIDRGLI